MKRNHDAEQIWAGGACNPRGVARALVRAIDDATENGSAGAKDPAVQMIMDHLCFLCGLPQPSLAMTIEQWDEIMNANTEACSHVGTVGS